jgi:hypothetical protein
MTSTGIPEEHKTAVITNGLHFMRSITEAYGANKGMELWETITSALDPEVKGQIFFAMITGTYNDKVQLKGLGNLAVNNAVSCIKEIRTWSGLGLKESKDIYDRLRNRTYESGPSQEFLKVKHEEYHKAVAGLRNVGFMV